MSANNCHQPSKRATLNRSSGKYDVIDTATLLVSRVDALHRDLRGLLLLQFQVVLQAHQLEYMLFVRPVAYKGTHLLSAIMAILPLSMPMPYIASTYHHRTTLTPMLTIMDGRATPTHFIRTLTLNPRLLYSHLGSSIEPPITHLLNPNNQNLTQRVLQSALFRLKPRLIKLLMSQLISQPLSVRLWPSTRRQRTPRLLRQPSRLAIYPDLMDAYQASLSLTLEVTLIPFL